MDRPGISRRSAAAFVLSLVAPSTYLAYHFLGLPGLIAYVAIAPASLYALHRVDLRRIAALMTRGQAGLLALALLVFLVAAFEVGYPIANSGLLGPGTDRDEHLQIGATELLHGRYPYYQLGPYEGFISQMPGALLLAVPFALVGTAAYQNLFWLAAFAVAMGRRLGNMGAGLLLTVAVLGLSPIVLREYVTGGDLLAGSICVVLSVIWVVRAASGGRAAWETGASAAALGISLSTRIHVALVLPLVLAALVRRAGPGRALQSTAIAAAAYAAVTLPFLLYDPPAFTPLRTIGMIQPDNASWLVGATLALVCVAASIACARDPAVGELPVLLRYGALVLAVPVLVSMFPASLLQEQRPDFSVAGYALPCVFFGAAAYAASLREASPAAGGSADSRR